MAEPITEHQFLYKYLRREHASQMLKAGIVHIGTLKGYRSADLGPAIGDADEGTAQISQLIGETPVDTRQPDNRSWLIDSMFGRTGSGYVTIQNMKLEVIEDHPDLFVYCMAHRFSEDAMRAFQADTCVQIQQPKAFIETLRRNLKRRGKIKWARFAPCDYSGRQRDEKMERIPAAFLKNPAYKYQHEMRLVMEPTSKPPHDFVDSIPSLRRFLSIYRQT